MRALFFTFLFCWFGTQGHAAVWEVKAQWNNRYENDFSNWVEEEWTQDIFKKGALKSLETDCADASYSMRALFAYQNSLPFQVTTGDGQLFNQQTSEFDRFQNPDDRFRRFLKTVYNVTDTSTLGKDTFPIALNREVFRAGILYVSPGKHSYQIVKVGDDGVPYLMSSTEPKENRILNLLHTFPFFRPESKRYLDGYRAFRWPQEMGILPQKVVRASLEQYQIEGHVLEFAEAVRQKVALRSELLSDRIKRSLQNLCYFSRERAYIAVSGFFYRLKKKKQCLSGDEYDEYSTDSRDKRLKDFFLYVKQLRYERDWYQMGDTDRKSLASIFVLGAKSDYCEIQTGDPKKPILSLNEVWLALEANSLSSNPNETVLARWGQEAILNDCSAQ